MQSLVSQSCFAHQSAPCQIGSRRVRNISSDSDPAFRQLERWLQECDSTHKCSPSFLNPALPTRVLHVRSDHGVCATSARTRILHFVNSNDGYKSAIAPTNAVPRFSILLCPPECSM